MPASEPLNSGRAHERVARLAASLDAAPLSPIAVDLLGVYVFLPGGNGVAMQLRQHSSGFVRTEGGLLPADLLERVRAPRQEAARPERE